MFIFLASNKFISNKFISNKFISNKFISNNFISNNFISNKFVTFYVHSFLLMKNMAVFRCIRFFSVNFGS